MKEKAMNDEQTTNELMDSSFSGHFRIWRGATIEPFHA